MVLYLPQAQRRRQLVIVAVAVFLLGGVLGGFAGRFTAPSPADRVAAVREQARQMSSRLRVLWLHVQAGSAPSGAGGNADTGLALRRADGDLTRALEQAPWITAERGNVVLTHLHELEHAASSGAVTAPFAADVDRLATEIDTTFGINPAF